MRNKRSGNPFGFVKDYAVPLVGVGIILLITYFGFFGSSSSTQENHENQTGISLTLGNSTDEVYVIYSGDFKKKIEGLTSLYKGEKVLVKEGSVALQADDIGALYVNKIGELKYNEDATFSLYSSDVWIDSNSPISINMRYAIVNIGQDSHVNLTQNEVGSTIYLLDGFAEVKNLGGKTTVLSKGQKIMISSMDTTKTDVDLSLEKSEIDDTFKMSDWYIKNKGDLYLVASNTGSLALTGMTATGFTATGAQSNMSYIQIENLSDEQTFIDPILTINGSFTSDEVVKIKLNSQDAIIDMQEKKFSIKDFTLFGNANELVFKVYNASNEILGKYPYTVYLKNDSTTAKNVFDVKNFSLDSTKFQFLSPKSNPYTTSDDVVMIEGLVPARIVSYIEVNGFKLGKFPKNGTYWKYFANKQFGNLQEGLNVYEVKYFAEDGSIIYKNAFTIVKTPPIDNPSQTGSTQ